MINTFVKSFEVSTHSRLKAAGLLLFYVDAQLLFQHTAA